MAKFQSPLLGYNNNVRHNGRVFHIQTEDSGVNHPHIITHLFMDGGRILKSIKRSYAEHVGTDGMSEIVRSLMKEQHKAMFISLLDGPAPESARAPESAPKTIDESKQQVAAAAAVAPPPEPPPLPKPPPRKESKRLELADSEVPPAPPSVRELTLDFDALERESTDAPSLFQASQLPPPPTNLFKKEPGTGTYRALDPEPPAKKDSRPPPPSTRPRESRPPASTRQPAGGPRPQVRPSVRPATRPSQRPSTEPRYAPARPAAIFGSNVKAPATPPSMFGDELVSDKSLDEVILSYLAEDLEPPRRK
jgi:hypothetical protein